MTRRQRKSKEAGFFGRNRNKIMGFTALLGGIAAVGAFGYAAVSGFGSVSTTTELSTQKAYAASDAQEAAQVRAGTFEEYDIRLTAERKSILSLEQRLAEQKDGRDMGGAASLAGVLLAGVGITGMKRHELGPIKEDLQYHHAITTIGPSTIEQAEDGVIIRSTTTYMGQAAVYTYEAAQPGEFQKWLTAA